jgi:hypothetical protein
LASAGFSREDVSAWESVEDAEFDVDKLANALVVPS